MERLGLPEEVNRVSIWADNDTNLVGQRAADSLAKKLINEGREAEVLLPELSGTDWNDFLLARQSATDRLPIDPPTMRTGTRKENLSDPQAPDGPTSEQRSLFSTDSQRTRGDVEFEEGLI